MYTVPDDEPRGSHWRVINIAKALVANGFLVKHVWRVFETSLSTLSGWSIKHGIRQWPVQPSATEPIPLQPGGYRTLAIKSFALCFKIGDTTFERNHIGGFGGI